MTTATTAQFLDRSVQVTRIPAPELRYPLYRAATGDAVRPSGRLDRGCWYVIPGSASLTDVEVAAAQIERQQWDAASYAAGMAAAAQRDQRTTRTREVMARCRRQDYTRAERRRATHAGLTIAIDRLIVAAVYRDAAARRARIESEEIGFETERGADPSTKADAAWGDWSIRSAAQCWLTDVEAHNARCASARKSAAIRRQIVANAQARAGQPVEHLVSAFAAKARKGVQVTAQNWADCGGTIGITAAKPLIDAEVLRQRSVAKGKPKPSTVPANSALIRVNAKHLELRQFRQKLANARPYSCMVSAPCGEYRLANCLVTIRQSSQDDWNRYSKAWHRAHGPARTYSTTITVQTPGRAAKSYAQTRLQHMPARTLDAVAEYLALPAQRGKLGLRIHPACELVAMPSPHKRCDVFARTFGGEQLDVVAVRRKQHFHDASADAACEGLTRKLGQARLRAVYGKGLPSELSLESSIGATLRGLGFCAAGTRDGLSMLGLDQARRYSPDELLADMDLTAVPAVARKYPSEVAAVAKVLASSAVASRLPLELQKLLHN